MLPPMTQRLNGMSGHPTRFPCLGYPETDTSGTAYDLRSFSRKASSTHSLKVCPESIAAWRAARLRSSGMRTPVVFGRGRSSLGRDLLAISPPLLVRLTKLRVGPPVVNRTVGKLFGYQR